MEKMLDSGIILKVLGLNLPGLEPYKSEGIKLVKQFSIKFRLKVALFPTGQMKAEN